MQHQTHGKVLRAVAFWRVSSWQTTVCLPSPHSSFQSSRVHRTQYRCVCRGASQHVCMWHCINLHTSCMAVLPVGHNYMSVHWGYDPVHVQITSSGFGRGLCLWALLGARHVLPLCKALTAACRILHAGYLRDGCVCCCLLLQALNEEEIFDAQFQRELYPLGWIHTHPTQVRVAVVRPCLQGIGSDTPGAYPIQYRLGCLHNMRNSCLQT